MAGRTSVGASGRLAWRLLTAKLGFDDMELTGLVSIDGRRGAAEFLSFDANRCCMVSACCLESCCDWLVTAKVQFAHVAGFVRSGMARHKKDRRFCGATQLYVSVRVGSSRAT